METIVMSIIIIVFLMVGWALIQGKWGQAFADELTDEDVLADRRTCGNCGCHQPCHNAIKRNQELKLQKP